MSHFASQLHLMGLVLIPIGALNFGMGIVIARNPQFPPGLGTVMQWVGISFVPAGAIFYLHPWDDHTTLRVGSTIMLIAGVGIIRFMRMRRQKSENST